MATRSSSGTVNSIKRTVCNESESMTMSGCCDVVAISIGSLSMILQCGVFGLSLAWSRSQESNTPLMCISDGVFYSYEVAVTLSVPALLSCICPLSQNISSLLQSAYLHWPHSLHYRSLLMSTGRNDCSTKEIF